MERDNPSIGTAAPEQHPSWETPSENLLRGYAGAGTGSGEGVAVSSSGSATSQ
jgi:hypothetical protein